MPDPVAPAPALSRGLCASIQLAPAQGRGVCGKWRRHA